MLKKEMQSMSFGILLPERRKKRTYWQLKDTEVNNFESKTNDLSLKKLKYNQIHAKNKAMTGPLTFRPRETVEYNKLRKEVLLNSKPSQEADAVYYLSTHKDFVSQEHKMGFKNYFLDLEKERSHLKECFCIKQTPL
jgi:hypothetical protein